MITQFMPRCKATVGEGTGKVNCIRAFSHEKHHCSLEGLAQVIAQKLIEKDLLQEHELAAATYILGELQRVLIDVVEP